MGVSAPPAQPALKQAVQPDPMALRGRAVIHAFPPGEDKPMMGAGEPFDPVGHAALDESAFQLFDIRRRRPFVDLRAGEITLALQSAHNPMG